MRGKGGIRKCRRCGERHPYPDEFGRTKRGTISTYCIHCRPTYRWCETCGQRCRIPEQIRPRGKRCFACQRETELVHYRAYYKANRDKIAARANAWNRANRERARQHRRTAWRNIRDDPERHAERVIRERMNARLRGRSSGVQVQPALDGWSPAPVGNHAGPQLPTDPLREWLTREFGSWPIADLATWLGFDDSHLGKIIDGTQRKISVHTADRIFVGADCTHLLPVLYPEAMA